MGFVAGGFVSGFGFVCLYGKLRLWWFDVRFVCCLLGLVACGVCCRLLLWLAVDLVFMFAVGVAVTVWECVLVAVGWSLFVLAYFVVWTLMLAGLDVWFDCHLVVTLLVWICRLLGLCGSVCVVWLWLNLRGLVGWFVCFVSSCLVLL